MTGAKAGDVSNTKEAILSKFAPALTSDMTDAKPDQQLSKAARLLFQTTQQMIAVIGTDCSEQRKRSPSCEFAFCAACARSMKIAASARKRMMRCGGKTGHS